MFTRKKVNEYKISVPRTNNKSLDWKGKDCLDVQYFVMAILGKRRTGKSTLIYSLLKYLASKKTIVIFFCPTFWRDATYESIRNFLDSKNIVYTDFQEVNQNGVNNVDVLMKSFEEKNEDSDEENKMIEDEQDKQSKRKGCKFKESPETKRKLKKVAPPEYILVFDDISNEIRDKSIIKLCKNSRHYKSKIILSTQSPTDLHPHQFSQLDYCAIFKDFNNDQVKQIYERIQPSISYEEFQLLYNAITSEKDRNGHNAFMLVDRANSKFRQNLNCIIDKK